MDAAGAHLLTLLRGQHYDGAPESLLAAIDVVRRTGTLREADRRDLADLQKRAEALVEHVTGKAWCAFPTVDRDGTVAGGRLLYVAATFGSPPPGVPVHAIPSAARDEVRAFVRSLLPGVAAGEIELWITDDRIRHRSLDAAACVAAVSLLLDHPVGPGFAATGVLRDGRLVDPDSLPEKHLLLRAIRGPEATLATPGADAHALIADAFEPGHFAGRRAVLARPPFPGLAGYDQADQEGFRGRDGDRKDMVAEIQRSPVVVVLGASAVGKSSFLRAALVPALSSQRPVVFLAKPQRPPDPASGAVLVIDQLEDVLGEPDTADLLAWVSSVVRSATLDRPVVLAIRTDRLQPLMTAGLELPSMVYATKILHPIAASVAHEVLLEPLRLRRWTVEEALLARVSRDLATSPAWPALLGEALRRAWELARRADDETLRAAHYDEVGGLPRVVTSAAESARERALQRTGVTDDTVMQALVRLTGEQGSRPCPPVAADQFSPTHRAALDCFVDARLVERREGDYAAATELLFQAWTRLAEVLAGPDVQESRRLKQELAVATRDDPKRWTLWTGRAGRTRLERVDALRRRGWLEPTTTEQEFLDRSRQALRWRSARYAAAALLVAGCAAVVLLTSYERAIQLSATRARVAAIAEAEALDAWRRRDADAAHAAATEALHNGAGARARGILIASTGRRSPQIRGEHAFDGDNFCRDLLWVGDGELWCAQRDGLAVLDARTLEVKHRTPREAQRLAAHPDGRVAVGWSDGGVDLGGAEVLRLGARITALGFDPAGDLFASADGGEVQRHRASSPPWTGTSGADTIFDVVPVGPRLLITGSDRVTRWWDADGPTTHPVPGFPAMTGQAVGTTVFLTAHDARDPWVVLRQDAEPLFLQQAQGGIWDIDATADLVATGGADGTVAFWTHAGRLLAQIRVGRDSVWRVRFSPDGQTLATSSWDGGVRVLSVELDRPQAIIGNATGVRWIGSEGALWIADDEGRATVGARLPYPHVASASWDGTTGVACGEGWYGTYQEGRWSEPIPLSGASCVMAEAEGERFLLATLDGHWHLGRMADGLLDGGPVKMPAVVGFVQGEPAIADANELRVNGQTVVTLPAAPYALATCGDAVAIALSDGSVVVTGGPDARLRGPSTIVGAVGFDPTCTRVVGGDWQGGLWIWDTAHSDPTATWAAHENRVGAVAWAGSTLWSIGWDRDVRSWTTDQLVPHP